MYPEGIQQVGWQKLDISLPAQRRVDSRLRLLGADIETLDVRSLVEKFHAWRQMEEYRGDYAIYNGALEHCLLEKILEHYVSLVLINPDEGMVGVDVGSCQSVFPMLLRRIHGVRYYEQDLDYPAGVADDRIGSSADNIPLPDQSVDFITLHCTFEHFEGGVGAGFVKECARLLKPGGMCVVLPLYMNESHCNITGEQNDQKRREIGWDKGAQHYCLIPEWQNRFGRHYSPEALMERIYRPAASLGLKPRLMKVENWEAVHPDLWLRWILVLDR